MARDTKLQFTFLRDVAAAVGTGGLRVDNLAGTAGSTTAAFIYANAAGTAYNFNRAASNALNMGGFRNTQADASVFVTQAGGSAIAGDAALVGMNTAMESYVRVAYCLAGVAPTSGVAVQLVVEAASDTGAGAASTDWTPISAAARVDLGATVRSVPTGTTLNGVVTSTAHGLSVGDIVVFTANTGGTVTLQKPYYVTAVGSANAFTVSSSLNGVADTTVTGQTAFTATASPAQKRIVSLPIVPTVKPWIRVAVQGISTSASALAASQGVWIQDAFYTLGRDMSALA